MTMPLLTSSTVFKSPVKPEDVEYKFLDEVKEPTALYLENSLYNLGKELALDNEYLMEAVVKDPNWKEIVVEEVASNLSIYDGQKLKLYLAPMSSYDAQARRQGLVTKRPLIVDGVLVSSDNYLMLGLRHGANAINVIPTEYATYNPVDKRKSDPLTDAMRSGLEQEVGLDIERDMEFADVIGVFFDYEYTLGPNYVWELQSNKTAKQIVEMQEKAKDSWEYDKIFGIKNKPEVISEFVDSTEYSMFPLAKGALPIYLKYLAGEIELWRMCDVGVANKLQVIENCAYFVNELKKRGAKNMKVGDWEKGISRIRMN